MATGNILTSMIATLGWRVDDSELDKTEERLEQVEAKALSLGDVLRWAAAAAATKYVLDQNQAYELQAAALTMVMGSADDAAEAVMRLRKMAASETNIDPDAMVEAFRLMEFHALDSSDRALKGLGDLAAGAGQSFEDVVQGVSELARGRTRRLEMLLGTSIEKVGDNLVFEFRGVQHEVENSAAAMQAHLVALGETDFAGSMDLMANTLDGTLGGVKWAMQDLSIVFGQAFSGDAQQGLGNMASAIESLEPLAAKAGFVIGKVFALINRGVDKIIAWDLPGKFDALIDRMGGTERIAALLETAFLALGGVAVIRAIMAAVTAMRALGTAAALAQIKMYAIIALFVAVGLAIEDFVYFLRGEDSLIGDFVDKFSGEETFFGSVARGVEWLRDVGLPSMKRFFDYIANAWKSEEGAAGKYFALVRRSFALFVKVAGAAVGFIMRRWEAFWDFLTDGINGARERWTAFVDGWKNGTDEAADGIIGTLTRVGSVVKGIVDTMAGAWQMYFSSVIGGFATIAGAAAKAGAWLGDKLGGDVEGLEAFAAEMDALQARQGTARDSAAATMMGGASRVLQGGNVAQNVGEVNVTIAGSTTMNAGEVSGAVKRGVEGGLSSDVKQLGRFAKGGL